MSRVVRSTDSVGVVVVGNPDQFAVQAASLAIATAPASPMSRGGTVDNGGGNFFAGDPGHGVNRFSGRLARAVQTFTTPIRPIQRPTAIRVGMQSGPSSSPAYPSTGTDAGFGALSLMPVGSGGMGR